jgi:hypothetical protein
MLDLQNKPLAAAGLTSYRCKGRYGYIMIGARDHAEAHREALRSSKDAAYADLEVWDGKKYVNVNVEINHMNPTDKALALRWYAVEGFDLITIAQHFGITVESLKAVLRTEGTTP